MVQWEYASEERLAARNEAYRSLVRGALAEDLTVDFVRQFQARDVLDVGCGMGELAEQLQDLGFRVAAIDLSPRMVELWDLVGGSTTRGLSFGPENGAEVLQRYFDNVERHEALGTAVFPDSAAIRRFVSMTIAHAHLAEAVPELEGPFETRSSHVVYVAQKPE